MELLHPLRARRERNINGKVQDAASVVAASIFDSLVEQEAGPYHIDIGRKPQGIDTEEYLTRVKTTAVDSLSRVSCAAVVEYDPQRTEKASTHIVNRTDNGWGTVEWDNRRLQVVFRQPEPIPATQ